MLEPEVGRFVGIAVEANRGRPHPLSRSMCSFIAADAPTHLPIVHQGEAHEAVEDGTRVRWTPAEMLPETLDDLQP